MYEDFESGKVYRFLTNNLVIEDPLTIAELYERKYLRDRRPDTFYHPVKHLGIVDGL